MSSKSKSPAKGRGGEGLDILKTLVHTYPYDKVHKMERKWLLKGNLCVLSGFKLKPSGLRKWSQVWIHTLKRWKAIAWFTFKRIALAFEVSKNGGFYLFFSFHASA